MPADALATVRVELNRRLAEIRRTGVSLSPLDLHSRMDEIRDLAAAHGLSALEGLAHSSAQRALLPGHRTTVQSCLERVEEALDSASERDRSTILAAVAVRLH